MQPAQQLTRGYSTLGGVACLRALTSLGSLILAAELKIGVKIVREALEAPIRQIDQNTGIDCSIVVDKVKNGRDGFGYNAAEIEYVDLFEAGIIDPTHVSRCALRLWTSGCSVWIDAIIEQDNEEKSP